VTNTGNVTLTDISIDDLVAGVTIVGSIAVLDPGEADSDSITGSYRLTSEDYDDGTFTNTATVTGTPPTGVDVTDEDSDTQKLNRKFIAATSEAHTEDGNVTIGEIIRYRTSRCAITCQQDCCS